MASETKILEVLFGPSIPTATATILPEIMAHIRAIDDLLQGKPCQRPRPRISDPAISGPINHRIVELYAEHGKDWPKIAATICQEFNVRISPDACRGRHKDAVARQEAYAALSGSAILAGQYTTPPAVMQEIRTEPEVRLEDKSAEPVEMSPRQNVLLPATFGQLIPRDQKAAQRPDDQQIEAIKKEALKLYQEGGDVKCIAEHLGVRWQWVRGICARAQKPQNELKNTDMQMPEKPTPKALSRAELDAKIWALWKDGKNMDEISDILTEEGLYYSAKSVRVRLLQQGAEL